jgi:hypothetical protein
MGNTTTTTPPAEPPKAPPPPAPAERSRLVLVGQDIQNDAHLTVRNEAEYTYMLENPGAYLRSVDFKLLVPGTECRVFSDDNSFYARCLILNSRAGTGFVELKELSKVPLKPVLPAGEAAAGWTYYFASTHDRWVVAKDGKVRATGMTEFEARNRATREQDNDATRQRR